MRRFAHPAALLKEGRCWERQSRPVWAAFTRLGPMLGQASLSRLDNLRKAWAVNSDVRSGLELYLNRCVGGSGSRDDTLRHEEVLKGDAGRIKDGEVLL